MYGLLCDSRVAVADAIAQCTNVLHVEQAGYKNRRKHDDPFYLQLFLLILFANDI